jgi:hypothetical protein
MPYRVLVWGPGNVGAPALRNVIRNPQLELAGVIVHSAEKEGRDAGELIGIEPAGVLTTRDWRQALASKPDALFYGVNSDFRPLESIQEQCTALRAGINVVTAGMYALLHPESAEPALREQYESACREGGSSFFSSGIDPGFAVDLLPLVMSGMCQEIREIRVVENFNYAHYDQPDAVRNLIGFGQPMDATPPMLLPFALEGVWGGPLRALAGALGLEVAEIRTVVEKHALEQSVTNAMGVFEAGTQGAFRFEVQAIIDGKPRLVVEHVTRISDATAPQWPRPEKQGYHQIRITGSPDIVLSIECEDARGDHAGGGNAAAAGRLVNAIPWVCEAEPGLLSGIDVPPISGRGLFL